VNECVAGNLYTDGLDQLGGLFGAAAATTRPRIAPILNGGLYQAGRKKNRSSYVASRSHSN
jgi:hypothetical protein